MLKGCEGRAFEDRRDAALICLLYDTGIRLAECAGLTLEDIDITERREIRVLGKGRKIREVTFGANTARALSRYIRARRAHRDAERPAFWLGARGAMTPSGIRQVMEKRGIDAGLGRVTPHRLRHSFAHSFLSGGGEETDLMKIAGGDTLEATAAARKALAEKWDRRPFNQCLDLHECGWCRGRRSRCPRG
jgi:site-specific recombinase XerD